MKTIRILFGAIFIFAVALTQARATNDDVYFSAPLTQVTFDRLIPTFYPTIEPHFNGLQPTTYPLIYPGVPRVHITENLVYPSDQPLLIVN